MREIKSHLDDDCEKGHSRSIQGLYVFKITTAKEFLADIKNRFVKSENTKINTFLTNLFSMRYMGKGKKSKKDKEASDKAPQKRQQKKPVI